MAMSTLVIHSPRFIPSPQVGSQSSMHSLSTTPGMHSGASQSTMSSYAWHPQNSGCSTPVYPPPCMPSSTTSSNTQVFGEVPLSSHRRSAPASQNFNNMLLQTRTSTGQPYVKMQEAFDMQSQPCRRYTLPPSLDSACPVEHATSTQNRQALLGRQLFDKATKMNPFASTHIPVDMVASQSISMTQMVSGNVQANATPEAIGPNLFLYSRSSSPSRGNTSGGLMENGVIGKSAAVRLFNALGTSPKGSPRSGVGLKSSGARSREASPSGGRSGSLSPRCPAGYLSPSHPTAGPLSVRMLARKNIAAVQEHFAATGVNSKQVTRAGEKNAVSRQSTGGRENCQTAAVGPLCQRRAVTLADRLNTISLEEPALQQVWDQALDAMQDEIDVIKASQEVIKSKLRETRNEQDRLLRLEKAIAASPEEEVGQGVDE